MKANVQYEASLIRAILVVMIGLTLVLSSKIVQGDSTDLSQEIASLQAQTDQLNKEIETLKGQVALMEHARLYIFRSPPSFHTDAATIQISQLTTAWMNRRSVSAIGAGGVVPIITFDLKNVGAAPIANINLLVSFYKPDKEVIGGGTLDLLGSNDAPMRTGMWKKVTIDDHVIQFPETRSAVALNADLYLQTDPGSYVLIDTYKISPSLEP